MTEQAMQIASLVAQRVNITTAAKLTGRAEKTLRAWLAEDPCPLSVEWAQWRGGRQMGRRGVKATVTKGRTRLLDVGELRALHMQRGGTAWHAQYLPVADLRADVQTLTTRIEALETALTAMRTASPWLFARETRSAGLEGDAEPQGYEEHRQAPQQAVSATTARPTQRRAWRPPVVDALASDLPDGYVSVDAFALQHGMTVTQRSTWVKAIGSGRLPARHNAEDNGGHGWKVGRAHVRWALDAEGRRAFWSLWHDAQWFRACEECLAFEHRP